jgi:hypothetical protein
MFCAEAGAETTEKAATVPMSKERTRLLPETMSEFARSRSPDGSFF